MNKIETVLPEESFFRVLRVFVICVFPSIFYCELQLLKPTYEKFDAASVDGLKICFEVS